MCKCAELPLRILPEITKIPVTVGIGLMARTCIRDGFKKPTASQDHPINKHEKIVLRKMILRVCNCVISIQIIDHARRRVASTVNSEFTLMYWHVGERINRDILKYHRAEYGKQVVSKVARQLQDEYGNKGFDVKNIRRMMQFACLFPDINILTPLVTK